jgi:hypothetical protein
MAIHWENDYSAALLAADRQGKPLFVDFFSPS